MAPPRSKWRDVWEQFRNKAALAQLTVAADWAPIRRKLKHLTFPVQKEVAEAMGDTKVRRRGSYLIRPEQLSELRQEMETREDQFALPHHLRWLHELQMHL